MAKSSWVHFPPKSLVLQIFVFDNFIPLLPICSRRANNLIYTAHNHIKFLSFLKKKNLDLVHFPTWPIYY